MNEQTDKKPEQPKPEPAITNERVGFHFSTSIRITDPESGQVLAHFRGD